MSKTQKIDSITKVKRFASLIPKTINEAINFDDSEAPDIDMNDDIPQEPAPVETPVKQSEDMDVMAFIDDIRKKSLKGMAQLADNPDDERYQLLKKIWQICEKRPESQQAQGNMAKQEPQF